MIEVFVHVDEWMYTLYMYNRSCRQAIFCLRRQWGHIPRECQVNVLIIC